MQMSLFTVGKNLMANSGPSKAEKMQSEMGKFDLAGTGGFLSVVKYLVFAVLASLNFHLFYTHVPGIWGVMLGSVALLFEACTIFFWNKQNKSAGAHKLALQGFAVSFTVISFIHGCAALYQIAGVGPSMEDVILAYSKFIAFPLLFGLMVLAVCTLHYLHWSTKISEDRAATILATEKGKAKLITEAMALEHESEIEESRIAFLERKNILEDRYAQALEKYAEVRGRSMRAIERIGDPDIRQEVMNAMGRTSTKSIPERRINPLPPPAPAMATDPKAPAPQE